MTHFVISQQSLKKRCMKLMRKLAFLKINIESKKCENIELADIFRRKNLSLLEEIIEEKCNKSKEQYLHSSKIRFFLYQEWSFDDKGADVIKWKRSRSRGNLKN